MNNEKKSNKKNLMNTLTLSYSLFFLEAFSVNLTVVVTFALLLVLVLAACNKD